MGKLLHTLDFHTSISFMDDSFATVVAELPHIHTLDIRLCRNYSAEAVLALDSSESLHTVILDQMVQFTQHAAEWIDDTENCKCPYLRENPLPSLSLTGARKSPKIIMEYGPRFTSVKEMQSTAFPVMCPFLQGTKLHELTLHIEPIYGFEFENPHLLLSRALARYIFLHGIDPSELKLICSGSTPNPYTYPYRFRRRYPQSDSD
jgi:hypothetical protein